MGEQVSKPIDLIVANTMHDVLAKSKMVEDLTSALTGKVIAVAMENEQRREIVARHLLCQIAHGASIKNVFAALKAVNAPCSHDDITESWTAVTEASG